MKNKHVNLTQNLPSAHTPEKESRQQKYSTFEQFFGQFSFFMV